MGKYIEVEPGVKLYVEDLGQGEPVVFLHGWPASSRMFEYQSMLLPQQGLRFIGIDFRGFGKSDGPWENYSYDRMADDVRAVVDKLGLERFTLVGFSMGGAIAVRYMNLHNEHGVSRLILAGAAAPRFTRAEDFPYGAPVKQVDTMINDTHKDRPAMIEAFGKQFVGKQPSQPFAQWLSMICLESTAHATVRAMESLRDEDLRGDLPAISVPVTVLHGVQDKICPLELAEKTLELVPQAELIRFEESGHAMLFDEPDKFNETLLALVK
ncbi:Pimeloyl-ACP methyl ester carboxylesterase [Paenibacillaceae bacterium GAS479]|nr:Pimeloyl-ACP methyl ester carboxylesterase [Paenibacillaceae bacterium GAS479]